MRSATLSILALSLVVIFGFTEAGAKAQEQPSLAAEVRDAAEEYGVPEDLLLAVGYVNARWEMPPPDATVYEEGDPHGRGAYGMMSLYRNPSRDTLGRASELTGIPEEELKTDRGANVRGAAALLAEAQGDQKPSELNGWYKAVAEVWDGPLYANQVYETLKNGASAEISTGERVELEARPEAEPGQIFRALSTGEYPNSTWYGASSRNYTDANRGPAGIDKVIIHVAQGSWSGTINWFKDPQAQSSAHYTVRSKDGFVGQSVREEDIAWHAGWWNYNKSSIGIEHEGYISNRAWFTKAMYKSSAKLTAYLARKYGIPLDRNHIIGHNEVPGCSGAGGGVSCHTDPGRYWDWTRYMKLVKGYARPTSSPKPYTDVVDNSSTRFGATSAWGTSSFSGQRYGKNYRFVKPGAANRAANFNVKIPSKGGYAVYAWWPANEGYNAQTTFRIRAAGGLRQKTVDQRINGGKWVYLGAYQMNAGTRRAVRISPYSAGAGYIIADAVKIVKR